MVHRHRVAPSSSTNRPEGRWAHRLAVERTDWAVLGAGVGELDCERLGAVGTAVEVPDAQLVSARLELGPPAPARTVGSSYPLATSRSAFFERERADYRRIPLREQVEAVSLVGDVALKSGEPQVHAHVVVAAVRWIRVRRPPAGGARPADARGRPCRNPSAPATPARRGDRPAAHSPLTMRSRLRLESAQTGCRLTP